MPQSLSLSYGSFLYVWSKYIWIGYIGCWHQAASIYLCIRGVERDENMLTSWDTFSVIRRIHPCCYVSGLLNVSVRRRMSITTLQTYVSEGHVYPLYGIPLIHVSLLTCSYVFVRVRYIKSHPLCLKEAAWSPEGWIFTVFDKACWVKTVKIHPVGNHDASYTQRVWTF